MGKMKRLWIQKSLGLVLFFSLFVLSLETRAAEMTVEDGAGAYAVKIVRMKGAQGLEVQLVTTVLRSCNKKALEMKADLLKGGGKGQPEIYWLDAAVLQTMMVCEEDLHQGMPARYETLSSTPLLIQPHAIRDAIPEMNVIFIFPREFELKVKTVSGKP